MKKGRLRPATPDHLLDLEARFRAEWETYLQPLGVKWVEGHHKFALMALYEAMPGSLSQSDIVAWFERNGLNGGSYDRQIRHRGRDGWHLATGEQSATRIPFDGTIPRDHVRLISMRSTNPVSSRTAITISSASWEEILNTFRLNNRGCAVCGRHVATYDRGHLDANRPADQGNTVPMCRSCNTWGARHKLDFVFDPVSLVARPKLRSSADLNRERLA